MYEVIVLGATFLAAGIAHKYKKKCLILERRVQAGYEFFGALNFGSHYEKEPKCQEALILKQKFLENGGSLYGCDSHVYSYLSEAITVFGAETVSVEKAEGGFICTTHGADGFCTYEGRMIVDTRCKAEMCVLKTYNMLIESEKEPEFSGVTWEKSGDKKRYVLRLPVSPSSGYVEARHALMPIIQSFSKDQRLILLANEFDHNVKSGYPKYEDGILIWPSKMYENPIIAFEAGYCIKEAE